MSSLQDSEPSSVPAVHDYLDALCTAKLTLRGHIVLEIEGLLRPREKLLSFLDVPISVAVSTVDAYAQFL